jgi:hypothetical protein
MVLLQEEVFGWPQVDLRIDKVHTIALISNATMRNRWIKDELLRVRETPLLSP